METHSEWVIEGCYSSLLTMALPFANEIHFLNPGVEVCQTHCRNRPWEPHKYSSKQAQDKNLSMLLKWVADYTERDDEFSLKAHQELFRDFQGTKTEHRTPPSACDETSPPNKPY